MRNLPIPVLAVVLSGCIENQPFERPHEEIALNEARFAVDRWSASVSEQPTRRASVGILMDEPKVKGRVPNAFATVAAESCLFQVAVLKQLEASPWIERVFLTPGLTPSADLVIDLKWGSLLEPDGTYCVHLDAFLPNGVRLVGSELIGKLGVPTSAADGDAIMAVPATKTRTRVEDLLAGIQTAGVDLHRYRREAIALDFAACRGQGGASEYVIAQESMALYCDLMMARRLQTGESIGRAERGVGLRLTAILEAASSDPNKPGDRVQLRRFEEGVGVFGVDQSWLAELQGPGRPRSRLKLPCLMKMHRSPTAVNRDDVVITGIQPLEPAALQPVTSWVSDKAGALFPLDARVEFMDPQLAAIALLKEDAVGSGNQAADDLLRIGFEVEQRNFFTKLRNLRVAQAERLGPAYRSFLGEVLALARARERAIARAQQEKEDAERRENQAFMRGVVAAAGGAMEGMAKGDSSGIQMNQALLNSGFYSESSAAGELRAGAVQKMQAVAQASTESLQELVKAMGDAVVTVEVPGESAQLHGDLKSVQQQLWSKLSKRLHP